jgi:hypothetical protein
VEELAATAVREEGMVEVEEEPPPDRQWHRLDRQSSVHLGLQELLESPRIR